MNDRALGAILTIGSLAILAFWLYWVFFGQLLVWSVDKYWAVALPVIVGVCVLGFIAMWIGWTMATTPPPTPIEETPVTSEEKKK